MALGGGGLDAQIEQRMDAYRSNPQQLQQRYGANKELLDLLALQKLTSEKQAAARDMQMKMQQQPGTIAQQREQEALELTKQQMGGTLGQLAQNTKSTLDQKQATQQQNMQRMAQGAARPQMGQGAGLSGLMGGAQPRPQARPAPQAQGLAAARMAQGPSKFAGGGIVSFAQGEGVSGQAGLDVNQTLEEQIARINARPELNQLQKETLIKQILAQQPEPEPVRPQRLVPVGRESSARMPGSPPLIPAGYGTSGLDVLAETNPSIAPIRPDSDPAPAPPAADAAVPPPTTGGITSLMDQKGETPAAVPTPEQTAASFSVPQTADSGAGVMPAQGTASADSAFLRGTQMADKYTGRAAANQSYEDMKAKLAEFDKENYGPRDDLNSFLIGMGGTGSLGAAMKGGYGSMLRSKNNRRKRLMDEFQLEKDRIGTDAVFSTAGVKLGTQLAADAAANERSMRSAAATMGAARMRAATADADRLADKHNAELAAAAAALETAREATKDRNDLAIKVAETTAGIRSDLIESVISGDQMLMRLNMQLAGEDDPEIAADIEKNMDARMQYLNFVVDGAMNEYGFLEAEQSAADQLTSALGLPTITADDVDKVTSEGE